MASVKDNFTVDYVMFSTFTVLEHASRISSRISIAAVYSRKPIKDKRNLDVSSSHYY
jgi:hypothetical protein